jgi:putative membrane protein
MLSMRCHHAFGELTPSRERPFLALLFLPLMLFGCGEEAASATAALGGDKVQGAELTKQLGCGSCHVIPGIEGANGLVGPSLSQVGDRVYIAGVLRNTPDNMVVWLRNPQSTVPNNAMPDMGLSEQQARDVASYLYTLE